MEKMIPNVSIPEGESGPWKISRFTVTEEESKFSLLRSMMKGRGYTPPGTYTKLTRNGCIVMSDTPDEKDDHYQPVRRAKGHVLINGLGLGMVLGAVLQKPEVLSVTVIEKSPDVLKLVAPHYCSDPRVSILIDDAFTHTPPKDMRYDVVWHDIWDFITTDNLPEMTRLKRKYGHKAEWQGCWAEFQCRLARKRGY